MVAKKKFTECDVRKQANSVYNIFNFALKDYKSKQPNFDPHKPMGGKEESQNVLIEIAREMGALKECKRW